MIRRYPLVEENLRKTSSRWKWLRLLQHTATLGCILCCLALLLGLGMGLGRITHKDTVLLISSLAGLGAGIIWVLLALHLLAEKPDRKWLAGGIERVNRSLLDRLNTLVFLEGSKRDPRAGAFASRIAQQAHEVLSKKPSRFPFSARRPLVHVLVFSAFLAATLFVYQRYSPWERLLAAEEQRKLAQQEKQKEEEAEAELAPIEDNLVETNQFWGEVRITEPGRDLQVTKLESVPLQIEAAANERLEKVGWRSAINSGGEEMHELPAPHEPRYAAYKPVLDLQALGVSEWDVITYYAKASTASSNSIASEVYFVEVRPFREDIQKIPGAGTGKGCYGFLKRLTEMIQRQQHIIRETHRSVQRPYSAPELQAQDRTKLAQAESDLKDSAGHLAADMTAALDKKLIGGVLDDLAAAQEPLAQASSSLLNNFLEEAQKQERDGLQHLVATRKHFQKVISENPEGLGSESDPSDEDQPPLTELNAKDKLKEITEFRNETKAAQDFLDQAVQKQKDIVQRAASRAVDPKLAQEEKTLQQSLEEFQSQHPQISRDLDRELGEAKQSLANAAQSLQKRNRDAQNRTQQALEKLKDLSQAMKKESASQQLADAYKLKQMIEQQIKALGQCEQSPGSMSSQQGHQLASDAKGTLSQLKSLAEEQPTRDNFDQPLRDALSDKNKSNLDTRLSRFAWAQGEEAKKQSASAAKEGLEKVRDAFTQSLPEALQAAAQKDALKPDASESFQKGLAQLESLLQNMEKKGAMSPEDRDKQGREALFNLQEGVEELEGSNERARLLLVRVEEELKKRELPVDVADFRKLLEQLRKFSLEALDRRGPKDEKPQVTNIDAARVPPAYRARIEKYFQKLSEESKRSSP